MAEIGHTYLGIELGSTRIKSILIGEDYRQIAAGVHEWENRLEGGVWTYDLDEAWTGLRASYRALAEDYRENAGKPLTEVSGICISAMMHGYLAFDAEGNLLVPFRTWRNTTTEEAAGLLSERFGFNVPQRWSVAHLGQAMLAGEPHVKDVAFMTTLSGYVHWKLTGEKTLGTDDASGMFPIDPETHDYDAAMMESFNKFASERGFSSFDFCRILPSAADAGGRAGALTEEGALLLDPSGALRPGIPFCPPEGDAGTGMVATNAVAPRTGNVSAGTSVFAMLVLEKSLKRVYPEIDIVTTPAGAPVAMVHCNNCTSDIDAWVRLFDEAISLFGTGVTKTTLYDALYAAALSGEKDGGGLLAYNYFSGEPITHFAEGRPLLVRTPDARFTLSNLMRSLLYASMTALKIGMDVLTVEENIRIDRIIGHGGLFKTKAVAQKLMASALGIPVAVMETAGEGGAWGAALLAAFASEKKDDDTLSSWLSTEVFADDAVQTEEPDEQDAAGFADWLSEYQSGLAVEKAAVEHYGRAKE